VSLVPRREQIKKLTSELAAEVDRIRGQQERLRTLRARVRQVKELLEYDDSNYDANQRSYMDKAGKSVRSDEHTSGTPPNLLASSTNADKTEDGCLAVQCSADGQSLP